MRAHLLTVQASYYKQASSLGLSQLDRVSTHFTKVLATTEETHKNGQYTAHLRTAQFGKMAPWEFTAIQ